MKIIIYLGVIMTPRLYLQISLLLFLSVYALFHFKKLEKPFQLLGIIIMLSTVSEIAARVLTVQINKSTPAYHFLLPCLVLLFTVIYLNILKPSKKVRTLFLTLSIGTFIFCIVNSYWLQNIYTFPTYSFSIFSILIVTYCLVLSRKMLLSPLNSPLFKQAIFWLNLGNFIFYSLSFFILAFLEYFVQNFGITHEWVFDFLYILNLLIYTCYYLALRVNIKRTKHVG